MSTRSARRLAVLLLAAAFACNKAPTAREEAQPESAPPAPEPKPKPKPAKPAPPDKAMTSTNSDIDLAVNLSKTAAGKLRVEYTVTNNSKQPVLLWDQVVTVLSNQLIKVPDKISTINGPDPETVLLVQGRVQPQSRINYEQVPGVRPLEAGKSITTAPEIDLPLEAWLAAGAVRPLEGTPKKAIFEVQYFPGDHPTKAIDTADGSKIQRPQNPWSDAVAVRSDPLPLP